MKNTKLGLQRRYRLRWNSSGRDEERMLTLDLLRQLFLSQVGEIPRDQVVEQMRVGNGNS